MKNDTTRERSASKPCRSRCTPVAASSTRPSQPADPEAPTSASGHLELHPSSDVAPNVETSLQKVPLRLLTGAATAAITAELPGADPNPYPSSVSGPHSTSRHSSTDEGGEASAVMTTHAVEIDNADEGREVTTKDVRDACISTKTQ
ncbi:hypothetical protein PI125_g7086 [Phytophthora idaei]|nr:hypothetical protein PI125_g7086 [Phytophthora idaei]